MTSTGIQIVDSAPQGNVPLEQVAVRLHPDDDVAIAKINLLPGTGLILDGQVIEVRRFINSGHKVALRPLAAGQPLRRYGQIIGFASTDIAVGDHVHTHNLGVREFDRDYAFGSEARSVQVLPEAEQRTFMGYLRADGRVGTRNYIALISTVNCSAHITRQIANAFRDDALAEFPNVDGVIPLVQGLGCATNPNSAELIQYQRTMAGFATHPNVGGYVILGLGCEANQAADLIERFNLGTTENGERRWPPSIIIQDVGGTRKAIEAGIAAVKALLPQVNDVQRTPQPASKLVLALECGGSDGWSGVTANPALGWAVDELVRQGGTAILSETPEIYGAEHLLTRRAVSAEVGQALIELIRWWEGYTARSGFEIDNNPSPGNKVGGLTTIYEKSLGAVAKGGTTPLTAVYHYAERVSNRGMVFMDTPGYDPMSVTGMVAGGANVVVFTTGRGSAFGFKPSPSIKLVTNSATYERMPEDMDINTGAILDGISLADVGSDIFERVLSVASGQQTKSEAQGIGEEEFDPWYTGVTL